MLCNSSGDTSQATCMLLALAACLCLWSYWPSILDIPLPSGPTPLNGVESMMEHSSLEIVLLSWSFDVPQGGTCLYQGLIVLQEVFFERWFILCCSWYGFEPYGSTLWFSYWGLHKIHMSSFSTPNTLNTIGSAGLCGPRSQVLALQSGPVLSCYGSHWKMTSLCHSFVESPHNILGDRNWSQQ